MKMIAAFSLVIVIVIVAVAFAPRAHAAEDVVRIEPGSRSDASQAELLRRVYFLEMAVAQLQKRVFSLEENNKEKGAVSAPAPAKEAASGDAPVTCRIATPFDGTFTSRKPTEEAAKKDVMDRCSKLSMSLRYCQEDKVKCE